MEQNIDRKKFDFRISLGTAVNRTNQSLFSAAESWVSYYSLDSWENAIRA